MRPVMKPLSREFIDSCRREEGRIIRGDNMTRIETFVDAAFAFAFTMLVISIDEIPKSPPELFELSRDIPAFVFSALIIGAVWLAHAKWSRTFGLQDSITVYLSLALVILMLVFVYPIKLMMQATVLYISLKYGIQVFDNGLFDDVGWADGTVAGLFVYVAVGLISLGSIIIAFYQNALRYGKELHITAYERDYCHKITLAWSLVIVTAMVSLVVALVSDEVVVAGAGYLYFSLFVTIPVGQSLYRRSRFAGSPASLQNSGH
ncbi:MAG: DUF1211 domain-containing protein [Gammaproteobacteria bacterium]|nr:DUF1211 domain-containing protein [Gammaproteobacteria bacterium]